MKHFIFKKINLDWEQVNQDLNKYTQDTVYSASIVESNSFSSTWEDQLTASQATYSKYGYTKHNTKIWKSTNQSDFLRFSWENELLQQLPLEHGIVTLTRQDPGQILPWHEDKFYLLKKQHPNDSRMIVRFLTFFQDWDIGHMLQVQDEIIYKWKQGDTWIWSPGTMHLAANVGLTPKWTCNITGFLTDNELITKL